ncbi:divergent polysaccharide deacetylase family protein [Alkalihalobacillus sp. R86527]|uniref:divergent polysaccharide deacetylase family protein n=1 Tax=Alkalihalobacillus sp. R86527 TaxID=3093863 RepID=UPI00366B685D
MKVLFLTAIMLNTLWSQPHVENAVAKSNHHSELAIVIDDFGNNMGGTEEMLQLPVPLTIAIMPFLPTTKEDAKSAHKQGHEVIVHIPMEPLRGKASWLGPGAITTDLSDKEIRKRISSAIDDVPYAVGMNHHMGSKVTADERIMRIVLNICRERGLYYFDSKTTDKSVIPKLANEIGVPYLENELFFDDIYTISHMNKKARELERLLDDDENHIAIGHVGIAGKKMVQVLNEYIPIYQSDATIVPLSELIPSFDMIDKQVP